MSRDGFLSRWSKRKLETKEEVQAEPVLEAVQPSENPPLEVVEGPTECKISEEQQEIIESLPKIEELTAESDFTGFLQNGVPEELQRLALRKLWKSNPVFANLDGLNDYDEDFSIITPLAEGVAEELKKLMKENSQSEPEETENPDEAQEPQELEENLHATQSVEEPLDDDIDDDDEVGDAEDDF